MICLNFKMKGHASCFIPTLLRTAILFTPTSNNLGDSVGTIVSVLQYGSEAVRAAVAES